MMMEAVKSPTYPSPTYSSNTENVAQTVIVHSIVVALTLKELTHLPMIGTNKGAILTIIIQNCYVINDIYWVLSNHDHQ